MTNREENVSASKRQALRKMLGIGAGVVTADALLPSSIGVARAGFPGGGPALSAAVAPWVKGAFNVRAMGATGDGKTVDTPAINRAIQAAARAGGGTVLFPAGTYLCFSIRLKSNIAMYLEPGATILAGEANQGGQYDAPEPNPEADHYEDFGHRHWHNALLWGEGLENVSIFGPGLLWGKGLTRGWREKKPGVGDKTISLKNCRNVTVRDISILHGGHFGILATGLDNFTVDNVVIDTNRDGIDIDCCRNVRLSNLTVNSPWDDGICLKSSYALGYARFTENLTLINCYVTAEYEPGTLLEGTFKSFRWGFLHFPTGRIKFGTESNGGFKNIAISNCVFERCRGLALESVDGALIEDVSISNVTMRHIVDLPIFMRLGSRLRGPKGRAVGRLRRVNISNLVASHTSGRYCSILSGIPGHEIEDVSLSNILILSQGGRSREEAFRRPPEKAEGYPEPTMFGSMPASGFYIRHVKGIQMSHVEVQTIKDDARPTFILDDVEHADFIHVKTCRASSGEIFALENVRDFNVYLSRPLSETHLETVIKKEL